MGLYKLVAVGKNALELNFIDGSPDLLLWQDRPIHLGRGVRIGEGYKFPNEWNSLSSRHCTLQYQGPEVRLGPDLIFRSAVPPGAPPVVLCIMSPLQRCARACLLNQYIYSTHELAINGIRWLVWLCGACRDNGLSKTPALTAPTSMVGRSARAKRVC